ncbi:ABC transporter ATP-binding protein [Jiangella endophytica]|uniref:ABC transporter ATP-binding protein n=1 Tax=Jiangella endophytica TaxID=1623398 RepID=UPI000E347649|nr:ABC transporter ATP-binding protein [Jiangella endophytica]
MLSVRDVTFRHGRTTILHGVGFDLNRGDFCGLLGPNGSGKSTLAKILARVYRPECGAVTYDGADVLGMSRREAARLIAYVPQSSEVAFDLSVRDAVLLGRNPHIRVQPAARDWEVVESALDLLRLGDLADRSVASLSGGQAQRVLIARALAQEPRILMLDEPTSALDLRYQIETLQLIQEITASRQIISLIAIHELTHAHFFCNQVVLLDQGRVAAAGAPDAALSAERISDLYGIDVVVRPSGSRVEIFPALFDSGGDTHDNAGR